MEELGVGGNYVWCLVTGFILFMGLGGAKRREVGGGFTVITCGGQATKEWEIVMERVDYSIHH